MLTTTPHRYYSLDEETDFIHNYYERQVLQALVDTSERARQDREFLADVACVALNRLPPRYIRHDVDMTFFMSPQEMQEMEAKVQQAVNTALAYVESREADGGREGPDDTAPVQDTKTAKKTKDPVKKPARKSGREAPAKD